MAPLKDPVAYVDCFCHQEHEGLCDSEHAFPKRPTESDKDSNPLGRRPFSGAIQYRRLIRSAPAKSLIRQIDLLELLLRFLLKPDVIRESIGMPYFRLIKVCLSYLFRRCPRLNLKGPTIAVVIAHRREIKKRMQLCRIFSVDRESCFARIAQNYAVRVSEFVRTAGRLMRTPRPSRHQLPSQIDLPIAAG
jgi:hypothetical protein